MNNVHYTSLAAVRMQDPAAFDAIIAKAVSQAVDSIGLDAFVAAMRGAEPTHTAKQQKIAA